MEGINLQTQIAADKAYKRNRRRRLLKQNIPLYMMFIPVILFFLIFKYAPMAGLTIAFKNYSLARGIWDSPWIGLTNYELLFTNPQTLNIIRNTLVLSLLQIVVGFPAPIILAILLNEVRRFWFKKIVQTLVYMPHFLSWVIVAGIVISVFAQESGFVNGMFQHLTGSSYAFLYQPLSWIAIFLGAGVWKTAGFSAIIYLAALTTIDPSLYEAAKMDGANKWREIWHITLPGIRTTIILLLILSIGNVMEVGFDQVYMLQNPVVSNVSEVISTYIYKIGLQGGHYSLTTAMGLFESLVGLILIVLANKIARKFEQGLW
jgi:putative aldouronate transport system permease protein